MQAVSGYYHVLVGLHNVVIVRRGCVSPVGDFLFWPNHLPMCPDEQPFSQDHPTVL